MTTTITRESEAGVPPASPFSRVLCGVDGSANGLAAVWQAAELAGGQAAVELVAVVEPMIAVPPAYMAGTVVHELRVTAERTLSDAQALLPNARARLDYGAPAEALLAEAHRRAASLLAVGSHGRHRLPGILFGSVATHVLHRAPCSVLIARDRGDRFPRSIVVGTDGSEHAAAAVRLAEELGRRHGVRVRRLAAVGGDVQALRNVRDLEWSDAPPVAALVAASQDADLLVLGSRGLRGVRALGSVSEQVGHEAACSVLVVR
jgi:nucleotide-binding universal stress UspA family protein